MRFDDCLNFWRIATTHTALYGDLTIMTVLQDKSVTFFASRNATGKSIQNVIGDSFRGATWVSIHNGGGVGWGEVINGGFGMVIEGNKQSEKRLESMLFWDVNNGIARRSWARNKGAIFAANRAMQIEPKLKVTIPNMVDDSLF